MLDYLVVLNQLLAHLAASELEKASDAGLLRSASTPLLGGWGPLLARCVMASGLGFDLDLGDACRRAESRPDRFLFSESNGRFLVTVRAADREPFERFFDGLPLAHVGSVDARPRLRIAIDGRRYVWETAELSRAFKETLSDD